MWRYTENLRQKGSDYEKLAGEYLISKGYEILEYNFRDRAGEIDLIARDGDCLVFFEVKYRADDKCGRPENAVDRKKQKRIIRTARYYLYHNGYDENDILCRFDVISIHPLGVTHYKNAFWGSDS